LKIIFLKLIEKKIVVQTFEVQILDFSAGVDQVTGLQEALVAGNSC